MTKREARQKAAQAWCTEKTSGITINYDLAEAFADILLATWELGYDIWKKENRGDRNEEDQEKA